MKTRATCIAVMLFCVMGCGLKGPLYLPDHAGAVVTRPAAGTENTGAAAPAQQPGATQQPGAAQEPAATQQPGGTAPKKIPGKADDSDPK
ncbi:MAG TPA: lipoprotein [Steroidobacteraceae bacterium]|nr:lipoprotein [Steroidobacteraceae bacterium]